MHKETGLSFPRHRASRIVHAFASAAHPHHLPPATNNFATITAAPAATISAAARLSKIRVHLLASKRQNCSSRYYVPSFKKHEASPRRHLRKIPPDSEQGLEVKSKYLYALLT